MSPQAKQGMRNPKKEGLPLRFEGVQVHPVSPSGLVSAPMVTSEKQPIRCMFVDWLIQYVAAIFGCFSHPKQAPLYLAYRRKRKTAGWMGEKEISVDSP